MSDPDVDSVEFALRTRYEARTMLYLRVYAAAVGQGMQNPHLVAKEALGHFDEEFGR